MHLYGFVQRTWLPRPVRVRGVRAGTLVYEDDDRALWDEHGNLVAPEEVEGPWRRVEDLDQLRVRFSDGGWPPRTR